MFKVISFYLFYFFLFTLIFLLLFFFFFQAEDGIRDIGVTGVQTCALPISPRGRPRSAPLAGSRPDPAGAARGAVRLRDGSAPAAHARRRLGAAGLLAGDRKSVV